MKRSHSMRMLQYRWHIDIGLNRKLKRAAAKEVAKEKTTASSGISRPLLTWTEWQALAFPDADARLLSVKVGL